MALLKLRQVDWAARRRAKESDELAESPKTAPAESQFMSVNLRPGSGARHSKRRYHHERLGIHISSASAHLPLLPPTPQIPSSDGFCRAQCWNFRRCYRRRSVRSGAARATPPRIITSSCVDGIKVGSLIFQLNGRSVMNFETTAACASAVRTAGARIGVWSGDNATLLKHYEDVENGDHDKEDDEEGSGFPRLPADCTIAPCPTDMAPVVGKRFAYKWDPPNGWFVDGTAAILHETGEHRNHLEVVWDDGDEIFLGLSTHLKPYLYGIHKRWVVLLVPPAQEEEGQRNAARRLADRTTRLALLPKYWGTMPAAKLLVTIPMQQLVAIAEEGDEYDQFRRKITEGEGED